MVNIWAETQSMTKLCSSRKRIVLACLECMVGHPTSPAALLGLQYPARIDGTGERYMVKFWPLLSLMAWGWGSVFQPILLVSELQWS